MSWLRRMFSRAAPRGSKRQTTTGIAAGTFMALAVPFIGGWEGLRLDAYQDIVGVWTVCYGETRGVSAGDSHTKAQCDAMLANGIADFQERLDACLTREEQMPVGMKVAVVSWSFNVGTGAACKSTLVRLANAGDFEGACNQLPRWNRAGGQVVRGLTNRRIAERDMCLQSLRDAA